MYIDPPWPTSDESVEQYLNFLATRLHQIYHLISEDGSLFIHLPPEVSHYVRMLLDRIFGKHNYRDQFVIPISPPKSLGHNQTSYSVIILYSRSNATVHYPPTRPYTPEEIKRLYPMKDENGRYRLQSLIAPYSPDSRPSQSYELQGIRPPDGRTWRVTKAKMNQLLDEGLIYFGASRKLPSRKVYLNTETGVNVGSIWDDLPKP